MTAVDHAELKRLAEGASERFAGSKLKADKCGLQIWAASQKGGDTHVFDVRGWGYLTGHGHGALALSEADGIAAQRAVQAYAVAAWNAVPALLSEIEGLKADGEVYQQQADYEFAKRKEAERQLDALRTQAPDNWRPIETAPKDGTHILLTEGANVWEGRAVEYGVGFQWWERNAHPTDYCGSEDFPTQWMPLPAAPALRPQTAESGE